MEDGGAAGRHHQTTMDSSNLLSPPRSAAGIPGKERRNPSITPRKFQRFFTPRSRVPPQPSAARKALRDLAAPAFNRYQTPSSPLKPLSDDQGDQESFFPQTLRSAKRRKTQHTPESSPLKPSSLPPTPSRSHKVDSRSLLLSPIESLYASQGGRDVSDLDEDVSDAASYDGPADVEPLIPLTRRGYAAHLVQRMTGGMPRAGRQFMSFPVSDWRMETADFCSRPDDIHLCSSMDGAPRCIPFCAASCHNNGMIAVGDEEGRVRLLDSEATRPPDADRSTPAGFGKTHLSFQIHNNAVIDLAFSEDDYLLASASGDQKGKVIDMMTQTTVAVMGHHTASLKQVRFQPGRGGGSVLATSSRDGSVQIWDLRCKGGPVQDFVAEPESPGFSVPRRVTQGCVVNSIYDAHARTQRQARQQHQLQTPSASSDVAWRGEAPGRAGEVSVTAIQFLPAGREHLLLSACEADASVKLWDIRSIHTSRQKAALPVAFTAQPDSHATWRPFGISSMSLGGDGARLYALCKDNTVYAYSTAHLVLGHAPELAWRGDDPPPRRKHGAAQEGLGPIYGFRHSSLLATSFYVKSALRPARDGRPELLAVGSSDCCAVLFPTDERYLRSALQSAGSQGAFAAESTLATATVNRGMRLSRGGAGGAGIINNNNNAAGTAPAASQPPSGRPGLFRTNSMTNLPARLNDTIPIVRNGTPLVRGHDREVGALTWTHDGRLVTVGDDCLVRRWAESRDAAADLRTGGETEGRRWACGWADVGDDWDEDEWC